MRLPRLRRRWVAVVVVTVVLAVAAVRSLDRPSWIYYYRVLDDQTLVVGTVTGPGAWARVTSVAETPSTVTISVSSMLIQLGSGTAVGIPVDSVATLHDPIGVETSSMGAVASWCSERVACRRAYLVPGCL